MRLRFGLAALSNGHFDNILVPIGTRHDEYLPRYGRAGFEALELAQLYHAPDVTDRMHRWAEQAPEGFRFPAKLWKDATAPEDGVWGPAQHEAAQTALAAMEPLRDAGVLGPVVAQFPPGFENTAGHRDWLTDLLVSQPPGAFVVELRHASWWTDEVRDLLTARQTQLVWSTHDKAPAPDWVTGPAGYVRFCGTAYGERGRHVTVRDRTEALLRVRDMLAAAPWDDCTVIVTNPFEGNAIDSLPKIAAALSATERAKAWTRPPGRPLLDGPPPGQTTLGV